MEYDFETISRRSDIGSHKWMKMEDAAKCELSKDIVPFTVADMEITPAPEIVEAICNAAKRNNPLGYSRATKSYYEAVALWMKTHHDFSIEHEWIVTSAGVIPALSQAVSTLTKPGDNVIIMTPVYYPFYSVITRHNRNIAENPLICKDGHYEIDFNDLRLKAENEKTTMLILSNPHNPVGRVFTTQELVAIHDICYKNNIIVVSDEIHFDLVFGEHKHTVFANLDEKAMQNCVICTSPSKTFNIAGLQTANIIIPNPKIRERYSCGKYFMLNSFGYVACEAAYRYGDNWLHEVKKLIMANYSLLVDFFAENFPNVYIYPLEGTYLVWIDFSSFGMNSEQLDAFFEDEAKCFFDNGTIFGKSGEGFQRINIACPTDVLKKALERIKVAARKYYLP